MNDNRTPADLQAQGDRQAASALGKSWYETLLQQRSVNLIGRSVDLAQLLGQRMNTMLRQSIETAVARFESKDVNGVVELASLLRATRLTHALLEKALPDIDSFEQAFTETNEMVTFLSFSSRIARAASNAFGSFRYQSCSAASLGSQALSAASRRISVCTGSPLYMGPNVGLEKRVDLSSSARDRSATAF